MSDFKVVLPTTTEEWQRDMRLAYNKAIDDFVTRCKCMNIDNYNYPSSCIKLVAEQLKGGVRNDRAR